MPASFIPFLSYRTIRESFGFSPEQWAYMMGYQGLNAGGHIIKLESGTRIIHDTQVRLIELYLDGYRPQDWGWDGVSAFEPDPAIAAMTVATFDPYAGPLALPQAPPLPSITIRQLDKDQDALGWSDAQLVDALGIGFPLLDDLRDGIRTLRPTFARLMDAYRIGWLPRDWREPYQAVA